MLIDRFLKHNRKKRNSQQLPLHEYMKEANQFVKEHAEVIIGRSDKGNSTVVMLRREYEEEVSNMLSDVNTYKQIEKDPTLSFQKNDI